MHYHDRTTHIFVEDIYILIIDPVSMHSDQLHERTNERSIDTVKVSKPNVQVNNLVRKCAADRKCMRASCMVYVKVLWCMHMIVYSKRVCMYLESSFDCLFGFLSHILRRISAKTHDGYVCTTIQSAHLVVLHSLSLSLSNHSTQYLVSPHLYTHKSQLSFKKNNAPPIINSDLPCLRGFHPLIFDLN